MFNQQKMVGRILSNVTDTQVIYDDRCVFLKHKKPVCKLCITYCPTDAIILNRINKRISIDPDKCVDCGICAAVCPTEVFKPTNFNDQKLFNRGKPILEAGQNLEIRCEQICEEGQPDHVVRVNCLGSIHQAHLLGLIALGAKDLHFRHGNCDSCAVKFGSELITRTIQDVTTLIRPFPELVDINLTSSDKPADYPLSVNIPDDLPKNDQYTEKISRREFLTSLIKKGQYSVAYSLNMALRDENQAAKKRNKTKKYLPAKRKLMLTAFKNFDHPEDLTIDSADLTGITDLEIISDQCSVCPTCANLCPTGALSRTDTKDKRGNVMDATLFFNASHCTKCGLCIIGCFTNAVHYKDQLHIRSFLSESPRILQDKNQEIL